MAGDKDGRTEAPTAKRKGEARKKGQVARSTELPMAVSLGVVMLLLPLTIRRLGGTLQADWQLAFAHAGEATPKTGLALFGKLLKDSAFALLPIVAVMGLAGAFSQLVMVGPRPNPHNLKPKFDRINPKNGIKRLFSKQQLWELLRNFVKLLLLAAVCYATWGAGMARVLRTNGTLGSFMSAVGTSVGDLLRKAAVLAILIGVTDAVVAKRRHIKGLRMTKHEVKEEHKQSEGNPVVKGEIKSRQRKMSRMRMIAAVGKADVVLANPTHIAIALAYEPGSLAPVVVAKGAGPIAQRIKEEARKHRVPVLENKPLARALYKAADIGDQIPVELYKAVAEVLAVVYKTRPRKAA